MKLTKLISKRLSLKCPKKFARSLREGIVLCACDRKNLIIQCSYGQLKRSYELEEADNPILLPTVLSVQHRQQYERRQDFNLLNCVFTKHVCIVAILYIYSISQLNG